MEPVGIISGSLSSGPSPRVSASKVVRKTPAACASGHSEAMNWVKAASVARREAAAAPEEGARKSRSDTYRTRADRSRVGQIEAPLDAFDPHIHPIQPVRHICVLVFETTDALLHFSNIITHVVNGAADMTQVLQNEVIDLGHGVKVSQHRIIVNRSNDAHVLPEDQREG
jgi:hypothetical protein